MSVFTNPAGAAKENAEAYVKAVLELLGEQEPLSVLEGLVTSVTEQMRGLTDEQARQPEAEGKWSITEVIQHLADSELVWAYRLRMVLAQDKPVIVGYDQDNWAARLHYRRAVLAEALEQIRILRTANLRLLRSLSPAELQRAGVHNERGEETVAYMMRLYAGHDLVHLRQIARIRAKLTEL